MICFCILAALVHSRRSAIFGKRSRPCSRGERSCRRPPRRSGASSRISSDDVVRRPVVLHVLLAAVAWLNAAWGRDLQARRGDGAAAPPTFAADVAPLLYANCVPCHHEGGAVPFRLVQCLDVPGRARQIVKVTGRRF